LLFGKSERRQVEIQQSRPANARRGCGTTGTAAKIESPSVVAPHPGAEAGSLRPHAQYRVTSRVFGVPRLPHIHTPKMYTTRPLIVMRNTRENIHRTRRTLYVLGAPRSHPCRHPHTQAHGGPTTHPDSGESGNTRENIHRTRTRTLRA
jgi:hypothetical protein